MFSDLSILLFSLMWVDSSRLTEVPVDVVCCLLAFVRGGSDFLFEFVIWFCLVNDFSFLILRFIWGNVYVVNIVSWYICHRENQFFQVSMEETVFRAGKVSFRSIHRLLCSNFPHKSCVNIRSNIPSLPLLPSLPCLINLMHDFNFFCSQIRCRRTNFPESPRWTLLLSLPSEETFHSVLVDRADNQISHLHCTLST